MKTIQRILLKFLVLVPGLVSLQCSQSYKEIRVEDFGAVPDDGNDDAPAVLAAISSIGENKKACILFEKGKYDFFGNLTDGQGRFKPCISVRNIQNLTIEGDSSELTGHNFFSLFDFYGCKNLSIKNLIIDWDPVPFSQGKVVKTGNRFVDIEVMAPFTAQAGLRVEGLLGYDPELKRMARRYTDHYQKGFEELTELVSPGIMRLFTGSDDRFKGTLPPVGKYIIVRHQIYGNQSFQLDSCENIRFENVTIYSNPGMGITGYRCRDIRISGLNVVCRPGSGRWMSTTADATHFIACRGSIIMENCIFEGMGDDATNINAGRYLIVKDKHDERILEIISKSENRMPPMPLAGDVMELSNEFEPLLPYAALTVVSANPNRSENSILVEFAEPLPYKLSREHIIANASSCPSVQIRNCTVIRNRARGFVIKTRDVVIENCTFQDVSAGGGVVLEADNTVWWESIASGDVHIRNNRFSDCRYEPAYISGVIEAHTNPSGIKAPAGVYREIMIENNIIRGSTGAGIKIGSAEEVDISNNIIESCDDPGILLYNSRNVRLTGNIVRDCLTGLKTGEGCDEKTILKENNTGF